MRAWLHLHKSFTKCATAQKPCADTSPSHTRLRLSQKLPQAHHERAGIYFSLPELQDDPWQHQEYLDRRQGSQPGCR